MSDTTFTVESNALSSDATARIQSELDQRLPDLLNDAMQQPIIVEDGVMINLPQANERIELVQFKCRGIVEAYRVIIRFGRTQVVFKLKGKESQFTFPLDGSAGTQSWLDDIKNSQRGVTPICVYFNNGGVIEGIGTF